MTEEEAIELLKGNFDSCPSDCYSSCEKCLEEANERAIEALEKQIPKKPNNSWCSEGDRLKYGNCQRCGCQIYSAYGWCPNCGQAIDWRDEENDQ